MPNPPRLLALVCLACGPLLAQEAPPPPAPLPRGPEAPTRARYEAARNEFYGQLLVQEHRRHRPADAAPDPSAERFLRMYGAGWWDNRLADGSHLSHMRRQARTLLHGGRADPLVLLAAGDTCAMSREFAAAAELIEPAVATIETWAEAPMVRCFATQRLQWLYAAMRNQEALAEVDRRREQHLVAAAADPAFAGRERIYLELVQFFLGGEIRPEHKDILARIAAVPGCHRYPLLVLQGRCEKAIAWKERGGGFASTVTEAGWKGFHEHMEAALTRFAEAGRDWPHFPEAPAEMVAILGAASESEWMRPWLDRTVAAEMDHIAVHGSFLWFQMPRWGGSHARMLAFAEECLATERFDTFVPDAYRSCLINIARDHDQMSSAFGTRRAVAALRKVHAGYRDRHRDRDLWLAELSQQVLDLALMRKPAEAARLYQALDGDFADAILGRYRVEKKWLMNDLEPHLQPHVPKLVAQFDVFEGWREALFDDRHVAQPIPLDAPEAVTQQRWLQDHSAWMQAVYRDFYQQHGHRDPRWDERAAAVLTDYPELVLGQPTAAWIEAFQASADAVLAAGCTDPAILYLAARAREQAGRREEALPLLRKALAGAAKHPALLQAWIARRLEMVLRQGGDRIGADALTEDVLAHTLAAARDPHFQGDRARWFMAAFVPPGDLAWRLGPFTAKAVDSLAADPEVDPWLRQLIPGLWHVAAVTTARVEVAPASVRTEYFEHVAKAEAHLTAAHALRPAWPEAATALIMLRCVEPGPETPRQWFERAVATRVDFDAAYGNFLWSLHPQFGGSTLAMYRFGVECLETGRCDTTIPLTYLRCLQTVASVLPDPRWAWSGQDVAQRYPALARQAVAQRAAWADHVMAGLPLVAWAGGRYEAAVQAWEAGGRHLSPDWLRIVKTTEPAVLKDLEFVAAELAAQKPR